MPDGSILVVTIVLAGFALFIGVLAFVAWYDNNRRQQ